MTTSLKSTCELKFTHLSKLHITSAGNIVEDLWWVLSSVWRTLTYDTLLCYIQCVSMLSAILLPPSAVTTADGSSKMAE